EASRTVATREPHFVPKVPPSVTRRGGCSGAFPAPCSTVVSSLTREDIQRLAISIATHPCREDPPAVRGDMGKVAAAAANAIAHNFATEAQIRREAEAAMAKMGRQGPEIDPARLLQGLAERIAKQKGFVL